MAEPKGILTLDLATQSGWAFLSRPGEPIQHGTVSFRPPMNSDGAFFQKARNWMTEFIGVMNPVAVGYEAPLQYGAGGGSNPQTTLRLFGLASICELVCEDLSVRKVMKLNNQTCSKHFCGIGRSPKDKVKPTYKQAIEMGFRPADDNAADAIAGLYYFAHCLKVPGFEHPPHTMI